MFWRQWPLASASQDKEEWVVACDNLSVTAQWDEDGEESWVYNPPPGWVIVDHAVDLLSENNGSQSVSTLAGGSSFPSERDIESARQALNSFVTEYTTESRWNKYKFDINIKIDGMRRASRRFSASHNTIEAIVRASGSGQFWDKRRGWMKMRVRARLRCLGEPDPDRLVTTIARSVGMPLGRSLSVENDCDQSFRIALTYLTLNGSWETLHWWSFQPRKAEILSKSNSAKITTNNKVIYFYAETLAKDYFWRGSKSERADRTFVVDREKYRFRKYTMTIDRSGSFQASLNCPAGTR